MLVKCLRTFMQRGNKRRTGCRCIGDNATRDDYYLLVKIDWHQRGTKFLVERVENMKKKKARIEKTKGNEKITRNCHTFKFTPVFFSTQCYRFVNLCKVLYFINSFLFFADHNLVSKIATNRNSFFFSRRNVKNRRCEWRIFGLEAARKNAKSSQSSNRKSVKIESRFL